MLIRPGVLADQVEHDSESTINVVEFVARQQTVRFSETAGVDGANLLNEHTSSGALDLYLRPEGSG